jgi:hypothetical protein
MEEIFSSETWINIEWTTRSFIPEDRILHNHLCKNRYPDLITIFLNDFESQIGENITW